MKHVCSSTIIAALRTKYDDYYQTAEIQIGKKGRVDFLAIRPSFSNPEIHAFEVKVTRQDFVNDNKWPNYLPACKQLWFVTKAGIVKKDEIPQECGHLELSKTGSKLFLRKKAPMRKMDIAAESELFRRIVHREYYGHGNINQDRPKVSRMERLKAWTREADDRKNLSNSVSQKVYRLLAQQQRENLKIEAESRGLNNIKKFLESKGIDVSKRNIGLVNNPENFLRNLCPEIFDDELQRELSAFRRTARHLKDAAADFSYRMDVATTATIEKLDKLREKDAND